MKKIMNKLEKKLERHAIQNLSMYVLVCSAIGYLLAYIPGGSRVLEYCTLEPYLIMKGQVWRLVTWIFCVSSRENIFFIAITLYFYYSISKTLETCWGAYRYNVYMFSGMLYTVLGAFVVYGIRLATGGKPDVGYLFTTYYICMSMFLAFAATFPQMEVLIMFVLPVKVKFLGILYVIIMVASCLGGGIDQAIPICASLFNFIIFFFTGRKRVRITLQQQRERAKFKAKLREAQKANTRHKCAICGKTETSDPNMTFRFCSKCNGGYEYCENHLFTHQHIE